MLSVNQQNTNKNKMKQKTEQISKLKNKTEDFDIVAEISNHFFRNMNTHSKET